MGDGVVELLLRLMWVLQVQSFWDGDEACDADIIWGGSRYMTVLLLCWGIGARDWYELDTRVVKSMLLHLVEKLQEQMT